MKTNEINIRDPYILEYKGLFYLYGTRSATTWGPADGFDCYVSSDLENWSDPIEIFHNYGDFWADRSYWAPECYLFEGKFYLLATFKSETSCLAMQVLRSDSPTGPFELYSDGPITPPDWDCLDGTFYFDPQGKPYLVFSHSFQQNPKGEMCAVEMKSDLSAMNGEIKVLFTAADAPWPIPFPYAEKAFGIKHDIYLSDGPCLYRTQSGRLIMLWSSFSAKGYTVGVSKSDNDQIDGNWIHDERPFVDGNGGHGMIFKGKKGELIFAMHFPNDKFAEKPVFIELIEIDDKLVIKDP